MGKKFSQLTLEECQNIIDTYDAFNHRITWVRLGEIVGRSGNCVKDVVNGDTPIQRAERARIEALEAEKEAEKLLEKVEAAKASEKASESRSERSGDVSHDNSIVIDELRECKMLLAMLLRYFTVEGAEETKLTNMSSLAHAMRVIDGGAAND